jgi:hypothetical protein
MLAGEFAWAEAAGPIGPAASVPNRISAAMTASRGFY